MGTFYTAFIIVLETPGDVGHLVAEFPLGKSYEFAMACGGTVSWSTPTPMPAEVWDTVKAQSLRTVIVGAEKIVAAVTEADHHMGAAVTPMAWQLRALSALVWQLRDDTEDERVRLILSSA